MNSPMLTWSAPEPAGASRWRPGVALLFVLAVASWAELGWRQGGSAGLGRHVPLAVMAGLMAAAHLAGSALEASAYALWWRARGAPLRWRPFFVGLVALSLVDRCSASLTALARQVPVLAPWLAPLAGPQLVPGALPDVEPGLRAALGGFGLLTLARIGATAWLQASGTGRRLRAALAVTACAWLAGRVAVWWLADLLRGASPLP